MLLATVGCDVSLHVDTIKHVAFEQVGEANFKLAVSHGIILLNKLAEDAALHGRVIGLFVHKVAAPVSILNHGKVVPNHVGICVEDRTLRRGIAKGFEQGQRLYNIGLNKLFSRSGLNLVSGCNAQISIAKLCMAVRCV